MSVKFYPIDKYTPHIGVLISQMKYIRSITCNLVKGLSQSQLDTNIDDKSNSIGTLLLHMTAMEFDFQITHLFERDPTDEEIKKYRDALSDKMHERNIFGNQLEFYLKELNDIRKITMEELKKYDDKWLFDEFILESGFKTNYCFSIRHLIDDEINHQSQISWMLKRMIF